MLIRHNGGGLRPAAAALIAAAFVGCSSQAAVEPPPSKVSTAQSPAADLRVHLDLLFAEQVIIVAKESEAAFNHSDSYASYTALLAANSSDLSASIGRAMGAAVAAEFQQAWDLQNRYLVDYAIGVVTHDDAKANAAMDGLRDVPLKVGSALPLYQGYKVWLPLGEQFLDDKEFIDMLFAQNYASFYTELHVAYLHTQEIGDALADEIVNRFPDKFPGRVDGRDVIGRVARNLYMQENVYLATMATDATAARRSAEKPAAVSALSANAGQLNRAWADWDAALVAYASGATFEPAQFAAALGNGAPAAAVDHLIAATIRVIDDQKVGSSKTLANDDRAAATAIQPIADSI